MAANMTKPHFFNLSLDELTELFAQWGMPRFRAKQVCQWVYQHHVIDPAAMSNLSKADRQNEHRYGHPREVSM